MQKTATFDTASQRKGNNNQFSSLSTLRSPWFKPCLVPATLACLFLAACGGGGFPANIPDIPSITNQITQFGITWTFDKAYPSGQFANGDYWVVGPVTVFDISPRSTSSGGRTMNGSMINPSPRNRLSQGYDSAMTGDSFNAALNDARPNNQDLSASNPLQVPVNSSLVSTISLSNPGNRPQLKTAAILTVLASAPSAGSFRPSYSGTDKTIRFNKSQLNYSLLGHLSPVANTPAMATVERYFERPWIDHISGWLAGFHHPSDNMPNYGRGMSSQVGIGALMLHLNFTNAEKETLLIRYVQLGLDWYGVSQDGGQDNWAPDGGHASGRKWPILFAGLMLNDQAMKHIGPGDGTGSIMFGEDAQTFYVTQADIDMHDYVQTDLGLAEWGIRHATIPGLDTKSWAANYRRCCTANAWHGFVLAARMMGAQALWAHDALFDYQDRYMAETLANNDPGWMRTWDKFSENMWDTYRASY